MRELSQSLKRLGKCVSRGRRIAIAKSAVCNPTLKQHIVRIVAREARNEMKFISSLKHFSILRFKSKDSLERFTWDRVWSEIEDHCPMLATFLKECLPVRVSENNGSIPSLCVCASIILKLRNPHINVVQGMISLILKSGHANQQVPQFSKFRLQILLITFYMIGFSSSSEGHGKLVIPFNFAHDGYHC